MRDPSRASGPGLLARLSRHLVGDSTLADTLDRVCQEAVDGVSPAVHAGISMTVDGRLGTYVFSHPDVIDIDYAQYEDGVGPCVDVFRSGKMVAVESTTAVGPHPRFRAAAARAGIHSVLALPLIAKHTTVGALSLFAAADRAFDERATASGKAFADQAAFVLANSKAYWEARATRDQLVVAMASRAEIEQAKGIIMHTMGVGADAAFETLRSQSQHENVKLHDLASDIVERAGRKPAPGAAGGKTGRTDAEDK
ncbi:MAG TPA: GAF and ANTAR domain-containing protein [Ilumatobacter sp.]|nr:GAF and ANTAR domain-containing protein [Ilumatobacter sp.]